MWDASVNEVDLVDARLQGSDGGANLRDHTTGDRSRTDKAFCVLRRDGGNKAGGIFRFGEKAGDIRNVDQFGGLEGAGEGGGGKISVDVKGPFKSDSYRY